MPQRSHILARAVESIDKLPVAALLLINAAVAGFVLVAHGGALAATYFTDPAKLRDVIPLASVTLPFAAVIILSFVVGLVFARARRLIVSVQALLLALGSLALFAWAFSLLANVLPESRFSWAPGLMTVFCVYPVYALRRTVLEKYISVSWWVYYLHLITLVIVLPVDVGVFIRAVSRMF